MRDKIILYINDEKVEVSDQFAFMTLANFLRYRKSLTGTKIVCAEGDCGACSLLVSRFTKKTGARMSPYRSVNSCIGFVFQYDLCHIITVEGLGNYQNLHPVQQAMVEYNGSQCGYCTPGFICALAELGEDTLKEKKKITKQKVKNYLTGNLCRCTGYEPIIEAGMAIDLRSLKPLSEKFSQNEMKDVFKQYAGNSVNIKTQNINLFSPTSIEEALKVKNQYPGISIFSGATDLGVLINKNKIKMTQVLSLNNIQSLYELQEDDESFQIGAKVSLNDLRLALEKPFKEFSESLNIFASPQIKNSGTLVGNVLNASPISDTIPFLMVANALIEIKSLSKSRQVDINDFFGEGYKNLNIENDEIVTSIKLPKTSKNFKLYKVSVRKDLDISSVTMAASFNFLDGSLSNVSLAFGGVGPKVLRFPGVEKTISENKITRSLVSKAADVLSKSLSPISDLRGSKEYRKKLCVNLLYKFFDELMMENNTFSGASI